MVLLLAQLPGGEQYYTATIPEAPLVPQKPRVGDYNRVYKRVGVGASSVLDFRKAHFGPKVPAQNPTQPGPGLMKFNPGPTRAQHWAP
ncbi:hypothetical protein PENANT_c096G09102, partial [Penicillium antarcticum]